MTRYQWKLVGGFAFIAVVSGLVSLLTWMTDQPGWATLYALVSFGCFMMCVWAKSFHDLYDHEA